MARKHSSEAFYALDDPLEAAVFLALVEILKEMNKADCENELNSLPSRMKKLMQEANFRNGEAKVSKVHQEVAFQFHYRSPLHLLLLLHKLTQEFLNIFFMYPMMGCKLLDLLRRQRMQLGHLPLKMRKQKSSLGGSTPIHSVLRRGTSSP